MTFDRPPPKRANQDRAIVPMINVVFLLLIFFLMTATLAPPPPLDITPPTASSDPTDAMPGTLYIAADGALAFNDLRGEAVLAGLAGDTAPDPLPVHADAAYPAADLAALIPALANRGITRINLITITP